MNIDLDKMPARQAAICAWYSPMLRTQAIKYAGERLAALVEPTAGARAFLEMWRYSSAPDNFQPIIDLMVAEINADI